MAKISITLEQRHWETIICSTDCGLIDQDDYETAVHALNDLERQYNIGLKVIATNTIGEKGIK